MYIEKTHLPQNSLSKQIIGSDLVGNGWFFVKAREGKKFSVAVNF